MINIVSKLDNLAKANKDRKEQLLREYANDKDFFEFLTLCCDTSLTFKVSRVKETELIEGDVFEFLELLAEAKSANSAMKTELAGLASQSPEHLDITNRILRHNMGCGIDSKTLNRVLPGAVPYSPYMRCSGAEKLEKIKYPAFSQLKCDGMFMNIRVSGGVVTFTTRNGKEAKIPQMADFAGMPEGVYMGEAVCVNSAGSKLPRALGNATITKSLAGAMSEDEAEMIRFFLWDYVSLEGFAEGIEKVPYRERFKRLCESLPSGSKIVNVVPTRIIFSVDDAFDHYHQIRETAVAEGEDKLEGTVVKDAIGFWEDGTSPLQVKMKAVKECEVRITGWEPGKPGGKYEQYTGAFVVQSECGKLTGRVSGMPDSVREEDPEQYVGKILTVKFNAVSKHNSFDHARFVEVREDKDTADTLEYILKLKG